MRSRNLVLIATSALCVWWSCSNPSRVESPEQALYVEAFLVPGTDTAVRLRRTVPPERYYDALTDSVKNALVQIITPDGTYTLAEDPEEPGTYTVPHATMPVQAGRRYELSATVGDRQLRAATVVPDPVRITAVTADTVVYYQHYGSLFGDLVHPGEWRWTRSDNSAGYIVLVEATQVRSVGDWALPLTAELDSLLAQRQRLAGQVAADSLARLEARIHALRQFFTDNVSLVTAAGDTVRWLRDGDQEDWDEIDADPDDSEGKRWREKIDALYNWRFVDYWVPQDTLRADYWWVGLRFEGEYRVTVQAADRNYVDYFNTSANGSTGNDGDNGPLFHVEGGLGVFGSYVPASFTVQALRAADARARRVRAWYD